MSNNVLNSNCCILWKGCICHVDSSIDWGLLPPTFGMVIPTMKILSPKTKKDGLTNVQQSSIVTAAFYRKGCRCSVSAFHSPGIASTPAFDKFFNHNENIRLRATYCWRLAMTCRRCGEKGHSPAANEGTTSTIPPQYVRRCKCISAMQQCRRRARILNARIQADKCNRREGFPCCRRRSGLQLRGCG